MNGDDEKQLYIATCPICKRQFETDIPPDERHWRDGNLCGRWECEQDNLRHYE